LLIGVTLVADGLGFHIPKGYIYSAMAFSVLVEGINIFAKSRKKKAGQKKHGITPFTGDTGSVSRDDALAALGGGVVPPKTSPSAPQTAARSKPVNRAQARPKSAPRKPKAPK